MQKFISKYGLAAHLALLAVAPLFLFPFFGPGTSGAVMLWLSMLGLAWLLLDPSRVPGEMPYMARLRVGWAILKDPLFWFLVVIVSFSAIRWMNGPVAVKYDAEETRWFIAPPSVPWLPGGVKDAGYSSFVGSVALTIVVMGAKHALGRSARLAFVFAGALFAGLAAMASMFAVFFEVEPAASAARCGVFSGSYCGAAYGVWFVGGVVALAGSLERKWNKGLLAFAFAAGASATGLLMFAPPYAFVGFCIAGIAAFLASLTFLGMFQGGADVLKYMAGLIIAAVVPVLVSTYVLPGDVVQLRMSFFSGGDLFPAQFFELRARLSEIAASVWRSSVWLGHGLGSFPLEARFAATPQDWALWTGQTPCGPLNGFWHLLAERGVAGAILVGVPLLYMTVTFVMRLVASIGRLSFFPLCAFGVVAVLAVAAEAFFDGSFLRTETLLAAASAYAVAASSFQKNSKPGKGSPAASENNNG